MPVALALLRSIVHFVVRLIQPSKDSAAIVLGISSAATTAELQDVNRSVVGDVRGLGQKRPVSRKGSGTRRT